MSNEAVHPTRLWLGPALAVGAGLTFTSTELVALQFLVSVTVTLYVMLLVGEALGLEIFVALNPVPGDHAYVSVPVPPDPVDGLPPITTFSPEQTESYPGPALAVTAGLIVSVIESTEVQSETVSVTVT